MKLIADGVPFQYRNCFSLASGGRQPPDYSNNQGADAPRSPGQETRLGRWRRCLHLSIALASLCWLVPNAATQEARQEKKADQAQKPQPKPRPIAKPQVREEVENIPLKYAKAQGVADIIQRILGGREFGSHLRFAIDDRSNSVLVVGVPEDISLFKTLLQKLDIPATTRESTLSTRVFPLRNTRADPQLSRALSVLRGGHIEVDPTRNVVIVRGDRDMQQQAASLLERLDASQEYKPKIAGEMQVRVVWLASGLPGTGGRKPPDDLKDVVKELAKMGVEDPRLVTQALVTALPDWQFQLEGLAGQGSHYRLSISGMLMTKPGEAGRLRISINAGQATINVPVGRVDTEITAPLGHSVVLGMTPTAEMTSVFVVQILPKK